MPAVRKTAEGVDSVEILEIVEIVEIVQTVCRSFAHSAVFDTGRISSGTAAELAGITRVEFLVRCGEYGVSVFQQTSEDLGKDIKAAHETRNL